MKKNLSVLFALIIIASMALAACQPQQVETVQTVVVTQEVLREGTPVIETVVVEVTPEAPAEGPGDGTDLVTFDAYSTTDIPTLDPQIGEDEISINYIENLFVQLTNYDTVTAEIVP